MTRKDLKRTLAHWPEVSDLATTLIDKYPALTSGLHRFELNESIIVTLIFDEVTLICAGIVKRGLRQWGFNIKKIPGYGRKREMLIANRDSAIFQARSRTRQFSRSGRTEQSASNPDKFCSCHWRTNRRRNSWRPMVYP